MRYSGIGESVIRQAMLERVAGAMLSPRTARSEANNVMLTRAGALLCAQGLLDEAGGLARKQEGAGAQVSDCAALDIDVRHCVSLGKADAAA